MFLCWIIVHLSIRFFINHPTSDSHDASLQLSFVSPGITPPSVIPPTARGSDLPGEKIAEIREFPNLQVAQMRAELQLRCQIFLHDGSVCCIRCPLPLLWPWWCQCWPPGPWTLSGMGPGSQSNCQPFPHPTPRLSPVNPTLKEKSFSSVSPRKQSTDNNKKAADDWLRLRRLGFWAASVFAASTNIFRGLPTQDRESGIRDKRSSG